MTLTLGGYRTTGELEVDSSWSRSPPCSSGARLLSHPALGGSDTDITGLPRLAWEAVSVVSGWARQSSPTHLVTTRLLLCWREEAGHQILCSHRSCLASTLLLTPSRQCSQFCLGQLLGPSPLLKGGFYKYCEIYTSKYR